MAKRRKLTIQESQRTPNRINSKEIITQAHQNQTAKKPKKENVLKAAEEKNDIPYKGTIICMIVDFSSETMEMKRKENNFFFFLAAPRGMRNFPDQGSNLHPLQWKRVS